MYLDLVKLLCLGHHSKHISFCHDLLQMFIYHLKAIKQNMNSEFKGTFSPLCISVHSIASALSFANHSNRQTDKQQ